MDPQACLMGALQLYKNIVQARAFPGWQAVWEDDVLGMEAADMDAHFQDLHRWLQRKGFAPTLRYVDMPISPAGYRVALITYSDERALTPYQIKVKRPRGPHPSEWRFEFIAYSQGIQVAAWDLR